MNSIVIAVVIVAAIGLIAGLGLAIVKHIVAIHSAEIMLESEVGQGTTIQIIF